VASGDVVDFVVVVVDDFSEELVKEIIVIHITMIMAMTIKLVDTMQVNHQSKKQHQEKKGFINKKNKKQQ
jgi:hypothetical protein